MAHRWAAAQRTSAPLFDVEQSRSVRFGELVAHVLDVAGSLTCAGARVAASDPFEDVRSLVGWYPAQLGAGGLAKQDGGVGLLEHAADDAWVQPGAAKRPVPSAENPRAIAATPPVATPARTSNSRRLNALARGGR